LEPDELFKAVLEAMNKCGRSLSDDIKIENLYISTLRQGFCLIQGSREITALYLNSDTSGEFARKELSDYGSKEIYEETGHWFAPQLTLPKILNLRKQKPELIDSHTTLLFVHDWLVWRFTNKLITEMTLVSAGQLAYLAKKTIHTDLLDHFGIPISIIPQPAKFADVVGNLNRDVLENLSSHLENYNFASWWGRFSLSSYGCLCQSKWNSCCISWIINSNFIIKVPCLELPQCCNHGSQLLLMIHNT
jgi:sugar (pentulose or hexulose) kinase